MSPIYNLGTTAGLGKKTPSKLGFSFKVAYRNLVRRKFATVQALICFTIVLTLTTVTLARGMIANQTTNSYVEGAIGKNIVIIGHPTITERYVSLLSQFFEAKETEHIVDYLNSDFTISDTFITKLDAIQGICKVDPMLILEHSVREILGVILDPVEQRHAIFIGDS